MPGRANGPGVRCPEWMRRGVFLSKMGVQAEREHVKA